MTTYQRSTTINAYDRNGYVTPLTKIVEYHKHKRHPCADTTPVFITGETRYFDYLTGEEYHKDDGVLRNTTGMAVYWLKEPPTVKTKHGIEVGTVVTIIGPSGHESRVQVKEVRERDGETVISYGEVPKPPEFPFPTVAAYSDGTQRYVEAERFAKLLAACNETIRLMSVDVINAHQFMRNAVAEAISPAVKTKRSSD